MPRLKYPGQARSLRTQALSSDPDFGHTVITLSTKAWSPPHGLVIFQGRDSQSGPWCPPGPPMDTSNVRACFCLFQFRVGVLLAPGRSRLGMRLNILQMPRMAPPQRMTSPRYQECQVEEPFSSGCDFYSRGLRCVYSSTFLRPGWLLCDMLTAPVYVGYCECVEVGIQTCCAC